MPLKDQPTARSGESTTSSAEVQKYFGACYEISFIPNNYLLPVGGMIYDKELSTYCTADLDSFKDFFSETQILRNGYNLENLQKWLQEMNFSISAEVFSHLLAFTQTLAKHYVIAESNMYTRQELYKNKGDRITLSDIFSKNVALCAEVAALAQGYLQEVGISSSYFNGDILWKREHEYSEKHTFIVIRTETTIHIYDPTNPIKTNQGTFPRISVTTNDFDKGIKSNKRCLVTCLDVTTNKPIYYGVNNNMNVIPSKDIV